MIDFRISTGPTGVRTLIFASGIESELPEYDDVDALLQAWSLDAYYDDAVGTVQELGWACKFTLTDVDRASYPDLLGDSVGAILREDTYGFTAAYLFQDVEELLREWSRISAYLEVEAEVDA